MPAPDARGSMVEVCMPALSTRVDLMNMCNAYAQMTFLSDPAQSREGRSQARKGATLSLLLIWIIRASTRTQTISEGVGVASQRGSGT